jgi:hypothetical protein
MGPFKLSILVLPATSQLIGLQVNALLVGRNPGLLWSLPQLLFRAGFSVDVIASAPLMRRAKFVRSYEHVPSFQPLLPALIPKIRDNYDWIIPTEDPILAEVLKSSLSIEDKLKLLPVLKEENLSHIYSKIGLSNIFSSQGVNTPPFRLVRSLQEALAEATHLGYPVLLKQDASGAGVGVFECNAPSDFGLIKKEVFKEPLLLQKMIRGIELDLSAVFLEGELVHFSYSKIEKSCSKFGPSWLRTYRPLHAVEESIFQELSQIGKVLGAHGFTNIACIESNQSRFYFEVDLRPNVWVQTPRFFGEDPALRIRKWFTQKETLRYPVAAETHQPSQILVPFFLRLRRRDLLLNRYQAWRFIPKDDLKLVMRLILTQLLPLKSYLIALIKRTLPKKYQDTARRIYRNWT